MDKNLKDYREKELKYYAIGNALVITLLTGVIRSIYNNLDDTSIDVLIEIGKELMVSCILSSVLYVYLFLLDAIVPGDCKDKICMLCRKLPGETIFDDIRNGRIKDNRFTIQQFEEKYKAVFDELDKLELKNKYCLSNSTWYGIYKVWEFSPMVFVSNRDYLLCRDLCVATLWISIIYLALVLFSIIPFSCNVIITLLIEMILTNVAMRSKQKRFAVNVIATDIKKVKAN
ncbi:MAG: hypothetical protein E7232_15135 [Lachnospiraceae bacterium]|jgi:hypothetical protein|nr:hypothetical protein [Lachnospiraceae bacterium]